MGRCALTASWLLLLVASEPAPTLSSQPALLLQNLPRKELRDVECEHVDSALADWKRLRAQAMEFSSQWRRADQNLQEICRSQNVVDRERSDVFIAVARPVDTARECALGGLSAALMLLICTVGCSINLAPDAVRAFEQMWQAAFTGDDAIPTYMLGTASWPNAALIAKWQAHCEWLQMPEEPASVSADPLCAGSDVRAFRSSLQAASGEWIYPLVWRPDSVKGPELSLGQFAGKILPALLTFMNSAAANSPDFAASCPGAGTAQGILLIFFRLLGPPVARDPLDPPRLEELRARVARLRLEELLGVTSGSFSALLVGFRYLCWRSHRLFGELPNLEIRRALEMGEELLRPGWSGGDGLIEALHENRLAQRRLWERVATTQELHHELWRQLARWLLMSEGEALAGGPALTEPTKPVTLCMGFGQIDRPWLFGFLNRALDVSVPRLVFVTPDLSWLLTCEEVRRARRAEASMLCVRYFVEHFMHYDHNNKAKFYMMPILLSLGVDVAWLDLDIFLFKDPTPRLVELAYPRFEPRVDVVVTDHFDEYCLNHGVFMVRASDRSLLWILEYIRWMHWYPFGHDQNGWDAFLRHSIKDPQLPEDLATNPAINASHSVLSTEYEFVTLTGWAGSMRQQGLAQLLHFTTTKGMTAKEKRNGLVNMFNATAPIPGESPTAYTRREQMARWKALRHLQAPLPKFKSPCYEGIHMIFGRMGDHMYNELLA